MLLKFSIQTKALSLPVPRLSKFSKIKKWTSAWMAEAAARITFLSNGYGGPSSINTFTCMHLMAASRSAGDFPSGSSITILKGVIRPLTTKPRMRFTMAYLTRLLRLPDAFLSFNFLKACSLSDPSGCPVNGVHFR
jgi:hypothetical protein